MAIITNRLHSVIVHLHDCLKVIGVAIGGVGATPLNSWVPFSEGTNVEMQ